VQCIFKRILNALDFKCYIIEDKTSKTKLGNFKSIETLFKSNITSLQSDTRRLKFEEKSTLSQYWLAELVIKNWIWQK